MTPREEEVFTIIRERGYLKVVIHPATFIEHRLERLELYSTVSDSSVQLRGWDFPHVDPNERPHINTEWAGQTVSWEHALELWRMYRSGQLLSISGIFSEWRDRSNWWRPTPGWSATSVLSIEETITRVTEVIEFARRLSQTKAGDDTMGVSLTFANMMNRLLITDSWNRAPLRSEYRSGVALIECTRTLARSDLVARSQAIAGECSAEVFSYFGWKPGPQIVTDIQREVLRIP